MLVPGPVPQPKHSDGFSEGLLDEMTVPHESRWCPDCEEFGTSCVQSMGEGLSKRHVFMGPPSGESS